MGHGECLFYTWPMRIFHASKPSLQFRAILLLGEKSPAKRVRLAPRKVCPLIAGLALLLTVGACSATSSGPEPTNLPSRDLQATAGVASETGNWELPASGQLDYQLGGYYDPDGSVEIVVRDMAAPPAADLYSICYVNAFQTQPGEANWSDDLLLKAHGNVVYDPNWPDEALLDTSTEENREHITEIAGPWIEQCARDGYQAVEFDNLDSYTRAEDLLSRDGNLALAEALVQSAHANGLAAGQKNSAQDSVEFQEGAGFDFALTESCAYYGECSDYSAVYGARVLDIEYSDQLTPAEFQTLCAEPESPAGMVLRDRDLVTPEDPAYVFETC